MRKPTLAALFWAFTVLPATAEPAGDSPLSRLPLQHDPDPGWTGVGALQLVLAGIVLAVWVGWLMWRRGGMRRIFSPAQQGGLKVVQSTALTARASLHVVRWDGREWLLGCTEHGIAPLAERAPASVVEASGRGEP